MKHIFSIVMSLSIALSAVGQSVRLGSVDMKNVRVVTNEVDALAMAELNGHIGPRLDAIEGQTNNWRQAWTWGNHAAAGYLAATSWQSWLSTNTYVKTELDQTALAALAAFAATNKTKVVHSSVSSNVWATLGVGGTVTVHTVVAAQVTDYDRLIVTDPHETFSGIYTSADGGLHWYAADWRRISIMPGYVGSILWTSGDTEAYGGDDTTPPFEFQEALNGFPLPVPTTSFALKAGYVTNSVPYVLTTGNVWQAVSAVQQTADAALFAADQAATLINYHTALDPSPHAGKFVTPLQLTNALAGAGSIIQPICLASTNIMIAATNAVYAIALTNAANIGFDFSALSLVGSNRATATVFIDCLTTQALYSVINTNAVAMDCAWEPTVTGRYELAVSSDGVRTTARQVWPDKMCKNWFVDFEGDYNGGWTDGGRSAQYIARANTASQYAVFAVPCIDRPVIIRVRGLYYLSADATVTNICGVGYVPYVEGNESLFNFSCTNSQFFASGFSFFGYSAALDTTAEYANNKLYLSAFRTLISAPASSDCLIRMYRSESYWRRMNIAEWTVYKAGGYPSAFRLDY